MLEPRLLAATAAVVVAAALPAIGVDRIVVTDGDIPAASAPPAPHDPMAFKSDYFPLDR